MVPLVQWGKETLSRIKNSKLCVGSKNLFVQLCGAQCKASSSLSSVVEHLLKMSKLSILNFQYNLSKKLRFVPVKWLSIKDRQVSDLMLTFQPNTGEMKRVFDKISNKEGRISLEGIQHLLEGLGREDAACEAASMMQVADLNRDGFIDFSEFMEVHKKGIRTTDIQSAFWMFDQDRDGRISPEEVRAMLQRLGENCSLEECRRMVRRVDKNDDGLVDMDDFMAMMTRNMKLV